MNNVLVAKEGYVYTNGETCATIIRLGKNDSVLNWYEITNEDAQFLQEEQKKL